MPSSPGGHDFAGAGNSRIADPSAVQRHRNRGVERFRTRESLESADNVGAGVLTKVMIAGYMNRKNDPPPGYKKIWEGYIRLVNMSQAYDSAYRMMTRKQG